MIDAVVRFYQSLPPEVIALIVSTIPLSAFQMKLTKWFSMQSDKIKQVITGVVSLLAVLIPALLGWLSASPEILGAYATLVFTGMTYSYRFVVKPAKNLIDDAKAYRAVPVEPQTAPADEFQA